MILRQFDINDTHSSIDIKNLVIFGSVKGKNLEPFFIIFLYMSIILPFDPITFPYLVTENLVYLQRLFDERKILSEVSLLAPYINWINSFIS